MSQPLPLLTVEDVAKHLGLSVWTVYRLVKRRELRRTKVGARGVRFTPQEVERYVTLRPTRRPLHVLLLGRGRPEPGLGECADHDQPQLPIERPVVLLREGLQLSVDLRRQRHGAARARLVPVAAAAPI